MARGYEFRFLEPVLEVMEEYKDVPPPQIQDVRGIGELEKKISETPANNVVSTTAHNPETYDKSLRLLVGYNISPEIADPIARIRLPHEIVQTYSRLLSILRFDTPSFVECIPEVFKYGNSNLESYLALLSRVMRVLYERFGHSIPPEFDWRMHPELYYTVNSLQGLEVKIKGISSLNGGLIDALRVYGGKKIYFVGIRATHQREAIETALPNSELTFHSGVDLKGLSERDYDVIVLGPGIKTHKITKRLRAIYGENLDRKIVNAFGVVNSERILQILADNSYRFKNHIS